MDTTISATDARRLSPLPEGEYIPRFDSSEDDSTTRVEETSIPDRLNASPECSANGSVILVKRTQFDTTANIPLPAYNPDISTRMSAKHVTLNGRGIGRPDITDTHPREPMPRRTFAKDAVD